MEGLKYVHLNFPVSFFHRDHRPPHSELSVAEPMQSRDEINCSSNMPSSLSLSAYTSIYACVSFWWLRIDSQLAVLAVYPGYIDISVGLCDLMDRAMTNFCLKYIFETGSQTPGYY